MRPSLLLFKSMNAVPICSPSFFAMPAQSSDSPSSMSIDVAISKISCWSRLLVFHSAAIPTLMIWRMEKTMWQAPCCEHDCDGEQFVQLDSGQMSDASILIKMMIWNA